MLLLLVCCFCLLACLFVTFACLFVFRRAHCHTLTNCVCLMFLYNYNSWYIVVFLIIGKIINIHMQLLNVIMAYSWPWYVGRCKTIVSMCSLKLVSPSNWSWICDEDCQGGFRSGLQVQDVEQKDWIPKPAPYQQPPPPHHTTNYAGSSSALA